MEKLFKEIEKLRKQNSTKRIYSKKNIKLFKEYNKTKDYLIRNKIVTQNIGLILNILKRVLYCYPNFSEEDLLCESIIFSCNYIEKFFDETWIEFPSRFSYWLYKNLITHLHNYIKQSKSEEEFSYIEEIDIIEPVDSIENLFDLHDFYIDLAKVKTKFSPREIDIFELFLNGISTKEISYYYGFSGSQILNILNDAKSKIKDYGETTLRKYLDFQYDEFSEKYSPKNNLEILWILYELLKDHGAKFEDRTKLKVPECLIELVNYNDVIIYTYDTNILDILKKSEKGKLIQLKNNRKLLKPDWNKALYHFIIKEE